MMSSHCLKTIQMLLFVSCARNPLLTKCPVAANMLTRMRFLHSRLFSRPLLCKKRMRVDIFAATGHFVSDPVSSSEGETRWRGFCLDFGRSLSLEPCVGPYEYVRNRIVIATKKHGIFQNQLDPRLGPQNKFHKKSINLTFDIRKHSPRQD